MSKFQAVFFPDPYDIGTRDVIMGDDISTVLQEASNYYKWHKDVPVLFQVLVNRRWHDMPRSVYREFNKMVGRF